MKPEPQPRDVICSVCGLNWGAHTKDDEGEVELMECVRLLKEELRRRPNTRGLFGDPAPQNPLLRFFDGIVAGVENKT